jgi:hypothetical protein
MSRMRACLELLAVVLCVAGSGCKTVTRGLDIVGDAALVGGAGADADALSTTTTTTADADDDAPLDAAPVPVVPPPDTCAASAACGLCGGTVLCDGTCSKSTPADLDQPCGHCGGKVTCDGCSVSDPPSLGSGCGVAGTVQCNGFCRGPLFRLYNPLTGGHLYTMSTTERDAAVATLGYHLERTACLMFEAQAPGTVPLYRAYNPGMDDHFYSTSRVDVDGAIARLGYVDQGIAGYVFTSGDSPGTVALFRTFHPVVTDHFYTVDAAERDRAIAILGYIDERIACYVFPP